MVSSTYSRIEPLPELLMFPSSVCRQYVRLVSLLDAGSSRVKDGVSANKFRESWVKTPRVGTLFETGYAPGLVPYLPMLAQAGLIEHMPVAIDKSRVAFTAPGIRLRMFVKANGVGIGIIRHQFFEAHVMDDMRKVLELKSPIESLDEAHIAFFLSQRLFTKVVDDSASKSAIDDEFNIL